MIFVVVDGERDRLTGITEFLLATFPGCTIFQHKNLAHALSDVLHQRMDALLVMNEEDANSELMYNLQRQKPELSVVFLSDIEESGYGQLPQTVVAQKFRNLLLTIKEEICS